MSTQIAADPKPGPFRTALALRSELLNNRRALAGVVAIVSLVAVWGLLQFDDAIAGMRSTYRQQVALMRRAVALGEDHDWAAHAKQSEEARQAVDARLWSFENEGVALANMQDWITTAGRDAKLDKVQVRIEMARPKGLRPDVLQMTATVSAAQTEAALYAFLERIAREPHVLVVDQLRLQTRPVSTMQMTLVSYAKLSEPSGPAPK